MLSWWYESSHGQKPNSLNRFLKEKNSALFAWMSDMPPITLRVPMLDYLQEYSLTKDQLLNVISGKDINSNTLYSADNFLRFGEDTNELPSPTYYQPYVLDHAVLKKGAQAELFFIHDLWGNSYCMKMFYIRTSFDREKAMNIVLHQRNADTFFPRLRYFTGDQMRFLVDAMVTEVSSDTEDPFSLDVMRIAAQFGKSLHEVLTLWITRFSLIWEHGGEDLMIEKIYNPYPVTDKFALSIKLVRSVSRLHQNNLIHGDIKCENVLVDGNKHIKLIDFGNSLLLTPGSRFAMKFPTGTQDSCVRPVIDLRCGRVSEVICDHMIDIFPTCHTIADLLSMHYSLDDLGNFDSFDPYHEDDYPFSKSFFLEFVDTACTAFELSHATIDKGRTITAMSLLVRLERALLVEHRRLKENQYFSSAHYQMPMARSNQVWPPDIVSAEYR